MHVSTIEKHVYIPYSKADINSLMSLPSNIHLSITNIHSGMVSENVSTLINVV